MQGLELVARVATELSAVEWKRVHGMKKCKRNFMEKDCASMNKDPFCCVGEYKSSVILLEHRVREDE